MKTIYPEETLALLAKWDELIDKIIKAYQQDYPDPPDALREILGDEVYAKKYHDAIHKRRCATLEDPIYQMCMREKAKIISLSPCTYQFDADEVSQWKETT